MITRLLEYGRAARHQRLSRLVSISDARERVRRGAAYLDGADPGWRARIDPERLELSDGSHCILGQLHGEYRAGLMRTRIWDGSSAPTPRLFAATSPVDLGFHARTNGSEATADLDYAHLNRAWREELARSAASTREAPREVYDLAR